MSQYCNTFFCGCQYYKLTSPVQAKVYLCVAFMLIIIALSVRIGSQWFIFKDYYPMKQRSPVLCILMTIIIAVQLILYPLAFTYNYFTKNWGDFKFIYRTLFYAFDGCLYFIYLLRSLRLVYAHEIDASRARTWIFQFFKHQFNLLLFFFGMVMIKIIPILVSNYGEEDLFLTFIDVNFYTFTDPSNRKELGFGIKQTIHQFVWLSIMIYCLWLQTLVHKSYSMKYELLFVLGVGFFFNIASIAIYWSQVGEFSIIMSICTLFPDYPILQMMRDINVIAIFVISIIYPIFKKRIYHMMLPIGRHHDIVKTMRDFLMTNEFIDIFSSFLETVDRQNRNNSYKDTLQSWKKLMVVKYKLTNKIIHSPQRIMEVVKEVINNIEGNPFKEMHKKQLMHLKESIMSLQELQEQTRSQQRNRVMQQISEKIEQLQQIFLQKLDQIYKNQYRQTKSYYYLKMYMVRNKRININMITMGMAVMVENEDSV